MKDWPKQLSDRQKKWVQIQRDTMVAQSLATYSYIGSAPEGFPTREASRNTLLGVTVSVPDNKKMIVGISYLDKKDDGVDEDIFEINESKGSINYFPKGRYEQIDQRYKGTHKGRKDYLFQ